jgi:hypothetical protein
VLAYLSRYIHRVAIANSRLIACDDSGVTFKWKYYRGKGRQRHKIMTLVHGELIRRFLIRVLPGGFHRIRHYGLFANGGCAHRGVTRRRRSTKGLRLLMPSAWRRLVEHAVTRRTLGFGTS